MDCSFNVVKKALICVAFFCVAAILAAIAGKMVISDTLYSPVTQSINEFSAQDAVQVLASVCKGSLVKLLCIFLAGFSVFAFPVSAATSIFRGAALGYTAAVISNGGIILGGERVCGAYDIWHVLLIYTASSIVMFIFSAVAMSFSDSVHYARPSLISTLRYIFIFLVFSGLTAICDGIGFRFLCIL